MKAIDSFGPRKAHFGLDHLLRLAVPLVLILLCACSGLQPQNTASPWPSSTPEQQGMDSQQLLKMMDAIQEQEYNLHSFLVLRHGVLVLEVYYPPFTAQDKHMLSYGTQSFTSALVGIVQKEGMLQNLEQPVVDTFSGTPIANLDEQKKNIHLQDLLEMSSGLIIDEKPMSQSSDWAQYSIDQPMSTKPGEDYDYNTGNTQLLSAAIQKATGKTTFEYAREKLFGPLGVQDVYWASDPSGATQGGVGLMLTPRDMAKFGYLFLHNGQWQGKQVVPAEWVQLSTHPNPIEYAYQWWQLTNGYSVGGSYGQIIYIIPSKDMVVVSTAGLPASNQEMAWGLTDVFVVSAVKSDQALPDNPAAKELAERVAAIANPKTAAVPALPATAAAVSGKTLRLDENPLGWKTAKLAFEGQQAWLTVTTATNSREQKFAIGLDGNYRETALKASSALDLAILKQRPFLNPFEFNFLLGLPLDGAAAMKGAWKDETEFTLTVQDKRDYDLETLHFQFSLPNASIVWNSYLDKSQFLTLTGRFYLIK